MKEKRNQIKLVKKKELVGVWSVLCAFWSSMKVDGGEH